MNAEQKKAIRAIIKNDCMVGGTYIVGNSATCAIGALALAAGVKPDVLRRAGANIITHKQGLSVANMREAIETKFGLTPEQMREIQIRNDAHSDPLARRKAIFNYVRRL